MTKVKVKDLKEVLEKLDEDKHVLIIKNYFTKDGEESKPEVELIKEIKLNGDEYYRIIV